MHLKNFISLTPAPGHIHNKSSTKTLKKEEKKNIYIKKKKDITWIGVRTCRWQTRVQDRAEHRTAAFQL